MKANDWKRMMEENCQEIKNLLTDYQDGPDVLIQLANQISPMIQQVCDLQRKLFSEIQNEEDTHDDQVD